MRTYHDGMKHAAKICRDMGPNEFEWAADKIEDQASSTLDMVVGLIRTALAGVGVVATALAIGFWLGYSNPPAPVQGKVLAAHSVR